MEMNKMKDKDKTKEQLINELLLLRQRIAEIEASQVEQKQLEAELKRSKEMLEGITHVSKDITEHKQAEEALRESEERYRSLFKNMLNGYAFCKILVDKENKPVDFIYIDVNDAFEKLTGLRKEDVIGKKVTKVIPSIKALNPEIIPIYGEVASTGKPAAFEVFFKPLNVWLAISVYSPRKEHFVALFDNITERKQVEEALKESEQRYRSLVHLGAEVGEAIVMLQDEAQKEGVQVFCNETWPRMTGYSEKELLSMSLFDLVHPKDHKDSLTRHRRKMNGESIPGLFEITIMRKDGTKVLVEVTSAYTTYQGKPSNVAYIRDITERKQQEKVRGFTRRLLEVANLGIQLNPTLKEFVRVIRNYAGCDAAGIRILDREGNIPYQAYKGFSREFYESESRLSIKSDQCMCINVIKGDTHPGPPYYTEDGSFYMNGTTAFLATVSEEEKGSTRNVCNEHGYESVALVPIRLGDMILGLIHIADKRTDMVPIDLVNVLEDVAPQIGLSIRRLWAEDELAKEKERLEVTLRSTGDGIIATDIEGKVVLLNRVAEKLTGWTQKEAAGRAIREVFCVLDERNRQPIPNPVENVIKTGRVIGLVNHALLISRDGTEIVIADSGAPIHDERGRIFGVVLVFRDITDLRKLQEEQLKLAKLESIGILAGGIAHDFSNFLTAIMGNIGLAKRYVDPEGKAFERLNEAENVSVRARDLARQLLTFSKGGTPIKKTSAISELVKEAATFALRGSDVRLELSLPKDLWAAEVDQGQISQVIQNMVINADEAIPAGGTLHISAINKVIQRLGAMPLPKGNYVQIDIKDEGIGMSKQELARLFEPYYTTKQKGSGLGLATAHSIIKNHGGHITVESTQNVRTTFHIYLPASGKPLPVKKKSARKRPVHGKDRILVMDDEEMIRHIVSNILITAGYQVELASTGEEAIERYEKARESGHPFDAVILDLTVRGGMGGKETIKKLLEIDPNVKAIVSSGYSTDPIIANFKKFGFRGTLTKGYKIEELYEALHTLIST
jgi:PAS domain S-box-containing protein